MNEKKLNQLFAAARKKTTPAGPGDFSAGVLRAIQREPSSAAHGAYSIWEHLNGLFPRVAVAACVVIILCVAADWGLTAAGLPGVSDGAAQVTSQFLFNASPEDL